MKKLIKKILREEINKSDRHYRILDKISEHVQLPYFKSMEGLTIYEKDDQEYIMRKILGDDMRIEGGYIYDDKGNMIYIEYSDGWWKRNKYDDNGNMIYEERSDGWWKRYKYDDKGKRIYWEDSDGDWEKWEYGNNLIYSETSNGDSFVWEYDENGNEIYFQNSDGLYRKTEYDEDGNEIDSDEGWIT
jgi:YD repeat-containing protein